MDFRRKCITHVLMALTAGLLVVLATTSVEAAPSRQAQERLARRACLAGDFMKGVGILSDLFVATEDPTYIFNQGRCFEQNMRYGDAIGRFQEYLRAGKHLGDSDRAEAEKHIADCQALQVKQTSQAPASSAPLSQPAPPVHEASPPPPSIAVPVVVQEPKPATSTSGSGLRTGGIITAAVGGAAVIGGIILNLKVNSMANDMQNTPGGYSSSKESDRKAFEALGWVGYGVGAACIATGAALYIAGLRGNHGDTARAALLPALGPGQAGAVLKGAF